MNGSKRIGLVCGGVSITGAHQHQVDGCGGRRWGAVGRFEIRGGQGRNVEVESSRGRIRMSCLALIYWTGVARLRNRCAIERVDFATVCALCRHAGRKYSTRKMLRSPPSIGAEGAPLQRRAQGALPISSSIRRMVTLVPARFHYGRSQKFDDPRCQRGLYHGQISTPMPL